MRTLLSRVMLAMCMSVMLCIAAMSYNVNDKVTVEWKGGWYPATVLKVENNKYFVHYDGYASSWDEWVTDSRIKKVSAPEYSVGESVQVKWKGSWYPASVLKVNNGKYYIHYTGYGSNWDEWVGPGRMKK